MQTQPADSLAASALFGMVAMLPAVNADALIGAFAGAVVYALSASEVGLVRRCLGALVSLLLGYSQGPELAQHLPIMKTAVTGAFLVSGFTVVTAIMLLGSLSKVKIGVNISVGWEELKSFWPFKRKGD